MAKEMLINASEGEECRIAVVENGRLEELYMERTSSTSHVGNIYKGKVTNVEASIQAAFIDFGLGRNGFLHISDLMPSYFGKKHEDVTEAVGRKIARRDRPPIQRCLKRGDEIIVQIIKEGIGTKGPTLSTYVSIPGRILVMMPGMSKFGISRKIEDEDERRRLRGILDGLKCPDDVGFIVRTAGVGKAKAEISRDLTYLTRLWKNINDKLKQPAPQELYTEGDLVTRTVRDVFSSDIDRIVADSKEVARKVKEFFKIAMPRTKNRVELHEEPIPLFHKYNIEQEIEQIYSRHVPLPSGGSLVIDQTEAIVAIDVNSGKFRDHSDAETTAFKTDMEAADEIPRQLKLRDLGGVIICDFIDLRFERHRRELEKRLHDNLKDDRAKSKVLRMSQFGIIEMTRQRMRPSLKKSIYCDCPHCKGSGLVKTPESMSLDMMRRLMIATTSDKVVRVELSVHPEVAYYLLNRKRQQLSDMEDDRDKSIVVRHDSSLALDEFRLNLYDAREGLVFLSELGMPAPQHQRQGGRPDNRHGQQRRPQPPPRGRGDDRRNRQHQREQEDTLEDARYEIEDESPSGPPREPEPAEIDEALPEGDAPPVEPGAEPIAEAVEAARGRRQRGGRGRSGRGQQPAPVESDPNEVDDGEETESQVVDVEDGDEPMGEAPRGYDDRGDRFRRNDRNRDRNRGGGHRQQPQQNRPPQQQNRPPQQNRPFPQDNRPGPRPPQNGPVAQQGAPGEAGEGGGRRRRRRRGRRGRGGGGQHGAGPQGSPPRQGEPAGIPDDDTQPVHLFPQDEDAEVVAAPYDDPDNDLPAPGNEKDAPPPSREKDDDKRRRRRGGRRNRERTGGRPAQGGAQGSSKRQQRFEGLPIDEADDLPPRAPQQGPTRADVAPRDNAASRDNGPARPQPSRPQGNRPMPAPPRPQPQRVPPPRPVIPPPAPIQVVRTGSADKHLADDIPVDRDETPRPPRSRDDLDELPEFDE